MYPYLRGIARIFSNVLPDTQGLTWDCLGQKALDSAYVDIINRKRVMEACFGSPSYSFGKVSDQFRRTLPTNFIGIQPINTMALTNLCLVLMNHAWWTDQMLPLIPLDAAGPPWTWIRDLTSEVNKHTHTIPDCYHIIDSATFYFCIGMAVFMIPFFC